MTEAQESWVTRATAWTSTSAGNNRRRRRSENSERQPLILSGHGMRLAVRHGSLEVWNGFTHFPQQQETFQFFPGQPDVPSRIVLLDGSGSITLDVLTWLCQQSIPLIQLDYRGDVMAVIGSSGLGADPGLLALQVRAASDPAKAMAVATWFVKEKLLASASTLKACVAPSESRTAALGHITRGDRSPASAMDWKQGGIAGHRGTMRSGLLQHLARHADPLEGHGT